MRTLEHVQKEQPKVDENKEWIDKAAYESRCYLLDSLADWYANVTTRIEDALMRRKNSRSRPPETLSTGPFRQCFAMLAWNAIHSLAFWLAGGHGNCVMSRSNYRARTRRRSELLSREKTLRGVRLCSFPILHRHTTRRSYRAQVGQSRSNKRQGDHCCQPDLR